MIHLYEYKQIIYMNIKVPRRAAKMCSNFGSPWGREWGGGKRGAHILSSIVIFYSGILQ